MLVCVADAVVLTLEVTLADIVVVAVPVPVEPLEPAEPELMAAFDC